MTDPGDLHIHSAVPYLDVQAEIRPDGTATARAEGELDLATAEDLSELLLDLIDMGAAHITMDVGKITFCDSQGLSTFVRIANRAEAVGGRFALAQVPTRLSRLLELTGLTDRLTTR